MTIIPVAISFANFVDDAGMPVLIPEAAWLTRFDGKDEITLTIRRPRPRVIEAGSADWGTLVRAARDHQSDVDDVSLDAAKQRIRRAIESGTIKSTGSASSLRIDPVSLKAWRLDMRERNLAAVDE